MSNSTTLKIAQATAIITSAFVSGGVLSISFLTVPALLLPVLPSAEAIQRGFQTPTSSALIDQVTQQWLWAYNRGKVIFPSLAASSAVAYTYLAYALSPGKTSRTYLTAAVVTMSIVPYTLGLMLPTNKLLAKRAARRESARQQDEQVSDSSKEENVQRDTEDRQIPELMTKWAWLNAIRGLFPLVGAAIGTSAALR